MPNKPEPLFIDGHYHYTLSSYDPVEATLTIPHLTDEEVGYGIAGIVAERGWKEDGLPTDAWVAENVEGLGTLDELKQAVREELEQINARYVASTKGGLCAEELAKRVEQRVPAAIVERAGHRAPGLRDAGRPERRCAGAAAGSLWHERARLRARR